ncbi:MAG TPA: hypothetical protein VF139_10885 [Candidatus Polarisedimenticolaceae bacterium]
MPSAFLARLRDAPPLRAILGAGLVAGALDITAAFGFYALRGVSPVRILQSVASGVMGSAAFSGGASTAALGAALHFFIATSAAAVFYLASRRLPLLVQRPLVSGAAYGVAVYLFMNHVVLPLSAVANRPFVLGTAIVMVGIHIVCVGLPIALIVRRAVPGTSIGTRRR